MMVLFAHEPLSKAGGPTLMLGPSNIIKSSLMLQSADGPLSQLPIHQQLGRLAQFNPSAALAKQMRDPVQRIAFEIERLCSSQQSSEQRRPLFQQDGGKCRGPESQRIQSVNHYQVPVRANLV